MNLGFPFSFFESNSIYYNLTNIVYNEELTYDEKKCKGKFEVYISNLKKCLNLGNVTVKSFLKLTEKPNVVKLSFDNDADVIEYFILNYT